MDLAKPLKYKKCVRYKFMSVSNLLFCLPSHVFSYFFHKTKYLVHILLPSECAVCTFDVLRSGSTLARSTVSCSAGRDQVAGWVGRWEPGGREGYECKR